MILLNEFVGGPPEHGFYRIMHIEQDIQTLSHKNNNIYFVAILSVDRREHNDQKHGCMFTI